MNFQPSIIALAAFLERPRSRKDLLLEVGLVGEKVAIAKEPQRGEKSFPLSRVVKCLSGMVRRVRR